MTVFCFCTLAKLNHSVIIENALTFWGEGQY